MNEKTAKYFIVGTFVTLYITVSLISTIHVIAFFELSNPYWLAVSLAIAFEIGAAASLASIITMEKMNKYIVWGLFLILTLMQAMGNAYYAYSHLHDYKNWVELFGLTDSPVITQKRFLAYISGAVLPLVALGFIKSLVDYIKPSEPKVDWSSIEAMEKFRKKLEEGKAEPMEQDYFIPNNNDPKEDAEDLDAPLAFKTTERKTTVPREKIAAAVKEAFKEAREGEIEETVVEPEQNAILKRYEHLVDKERDYEAEKLPITKEIFNEIRGWNEKQEAAVEFGTAVHEVVEQELAGDREPTAAEIEKEDKWVEKLQQMPEIPEVELTAEQPINYPPLPTQEQLNQLQPGVVAFKPVVDRITKEDTRRKTDVREIAKEVVKKALAEKQENGNK